MLFRASNQGDVDLSPDPLCPAHEEALSCHDRRLG